MTATAPTQVHAREAGFLGDVISVATRALRSVSRDPETVIPALIVPVFFFAVNIGALEDIVEQGSNIDFKAFQLPVAIIFAVTGVSRAVTLVLDIQSDDGLDGDDRDVQPRHVPTGGSPLSRNRGLGLARPGPGAGVSRGRGRGQPVARPVGPARPRHPPLAPRRLRRVEARYVRRRPCARKSRQDFIRRCSTFTTSERNAAIVPPTS